MIRCPVCLTAYVANTLFCTECGLYLLEGEDLGTDPLETAQVKWLGENTPEANRVWDTLDTGPLTIRLRIGRSGRVRELEIPVTKPIRLGRMDPLQNIYPEVDLTQDLAMEHGVSREHACIFRRGEIVVIEDLGSTNGTLLNSKRLSPFLPQLLEDGDQLQLGKLLIEVCFKTCHHSESPLQPSHTGVDGC
ncbi:MAG: FHA domain-containing protein [Anaerolineae bacterium]